MSDAGLLELEAAVFICSAILVSYALDAGAYPQAGLAAGLFIVWNAWVHRKADKKTKRQR